MKIVRSALVPFLLVLMIAASIGFGGQRVSAQDGEITSSGFVSGPWRILVLQTVVGDQISEAGLEAASEGEWVLAVAEVTNTGVATVFDPASVLFGYAEVPLGMTTGVAPDLAATVIASQALALSGVTPEGTFVVNENGTIRLALAYQVAESPGNDQLPVLRLNDQVMDISNTYVETLDVAGLPALVSEMQLQVADITTAVGGGRIEVALRTGGTAAVEMDSVASPQAAASVSSSCYSGESATQVMNLTGGTVWIEEVQESGESLVWFNDPSTGSFGLLNAHLIAGGFAGVDGEASPYSSWLGAVEEYAKSQDTGLWNVCKDAQGTWINEPLPTPVPTQSAEQVRAQYQWVDTRDLVIRPGEFEGDKIAVAGTVFNIDVEGDLTVMQIWLDGGSEAAVIGYEGDSRGIYEGTWVTVYGVGIGTVEGTNAFGGVIVQPAILADIVDF